MVLVFLSTTNYLVSLDSLFLSHPMLNLAFSQVDAYLQYSASALAANAVLRCILGAILQVLPQSSSLATR